MARHGTSGSRAEHIHDRLRHEILEGRIAPGTHLQPAALATTTAASTTVIRDALLRLVGERLCVQVPSRGFFVPTLQLDRLADMTTVRIHNDTLALRLAIERGDLAWESDVVAVHHALSRTARRDSSDPLHTTDEWARCHRHFHLTLVAGCNVPLLTDLCSTLFDSTELYRRWAAPSPAASERNVDAEHARIVEAALARDATRAEELLADHYEKTLEVVLAAGLVDAPDWMRKRTGESASAYSPSVA